MALSDWFAGLEVEYEELAVHVGFDSGAYSQRIVTLCGKTLKHLNLSLCKCFVFWTVLRASVNLIPKWASLHVSSIVQNFASWSSVGRIQQAGMKLQYPPSPP